MDDSSLNYWDSRHPQYEITLQQLEDQAQLRDPAVRRRQRDWLDWALNCSGRKDDAILLHGDVIKAADYAQLGEQLVREGLAAGESAFNVFGRQNRDEMRCAVLAALHDCSWHNSGTENEQLLRDAYAHAKRFAESNLKLLRQKYQRPRIQIVVFDAMKAGDFVFARQLATEAARTRKLPLRTDLDVIRDLDSLLLLVSTYLADPAGETELRAPVVAALDAYFTAWQLGRPLTIDEWLPPRAIDLSYVAAKQFEEFRLPEFTYWAVVRRLRDKPG
jgi:hypothetical protein